MSELVKGDCIRGVGVSKSEKMLSVTQAADLCGLGRSTVSYWIKRKKIHAHRNGKKYLISLGELIFHLKSTGRKIPPRIAYENLKTPVFRAMCRCWEYWREKSEERNCDECPVHAHGREICFPSVAEDHLQHCGERCGECRFYMEGYLPRIEFVNQFDIPALIYKDLHIWIGNEKFAQLLGFQQNDMIGMGIERVIHQDSLEEVIVRESKRALNIMSVPSLKRVFINNQHKGKIPALFRVCRLREPENAFCAFVEPDEVIV